MSAAFVRVTSLLALESCSLVLAASALVLTPLGLLSMARLKTQFFCLINDDDRSGLQDEMPGGFHTHPGQKDLFLGGGNERL